MSETNETTSTYQSVSIRKGRGGWGAGLTLTPTEKNNVVLSVTGGGVHPVAAKIAELSGAEAVDGFTNHVADDRVLCAVINCGGTARIGVYPRKRIPTVDVYPGEPGGPLAQFITEDIFVSAVTPGDVAVAGDLVAPIAAVSEQVDALDADRARYEAQKAQAKEAAVASGGFTKLVVSFGGAIGYFINTLLSSGRQAVKLVLNTIIPFMAYVSLRFGVLAVAEARNAPARSETVSAPARSVLNSGSGR